MAKAVKVQKNWGPDRTGKVRRIQRKGGLILGAGQGKENIQLIGQEHNGTQRHECLGRGGGVSMHEYH